MDYGYLRVSTREQAIKGAGLGAQRHSIDYWANGVGRQVKYVEDKGRTAANLRRPGIQAILRDLRPGDTLVVAKLDRISRSVQDFASLLARARKGGWALICLDVGVDMTTPAGEMVANVMAAFAQYERQLIGQRTADGMAAKRAAGTLKGPIGRPRQVPDAVRNRVATEWSAGRSLRSIGEGLELDGILPPRAAHWHPSSVRFLIG